jgi:lysophospholipase L1-like esterase
MRRLLAAWAALLALAAPALAAAVPAGTSPPPAAISPAKLYLQVLQQVQVRQVQATPAAVTYGTSHTLSSPAFIPAVTAQYPGYATASLSPLYAYRKGSGPKVYGSTGNQYQYIKLTGVNYGTTTGQASNMYSVPILTDGAGVGVEFAVGDNAQHMTVKIDGQYYSLTGITAGNTGAEEYLFVPLTDGRLHEVEAIWSGTARFYGLYAPATATVDPAPARGPKMIWLGDSGCEPTIPDNTTANAVPWNGMAQQFADALGWDDVRTACVGSTGPINPGTGGRVNWLSRISTDVCPYSPDIVWLPWSINDIAYTPAQEVAQEAAIVAAIRACAPSAQIIMASAWANKGGGYLLTSYYAMDAAVRAWARSQGLLYDDILEQALPAWKTPQASTLYAAIVSTGAAVAINTTSQLQIGATYAFADGQHFRVTDASYIGAGDYQHHTDAITQTEAVGAAITEVGPSVQAGTGNQANPTGSGNNDLVIGNDQTHPTGYGQALIGTAYARQLLNFFKPGTAAGGF